MHFIDLKTQYRLIREDVHQRIDQVLEHGRYIMGPEVEELEERLAEYVGVSHCIGVSSGTDALLIALMALEVCAGDEVITTPFSFIATAETIVLSGAKPVFVDIDPRTYNIDPDLIEAAITPNTRAIMPVSLYGQCANFDAINAIAERHGLPVIEDAAQSFGASYKGRKSCTLSTIGCTSFFPSKPLGCYGDGGACFTHDENLAKIMREIRAHGQDRRYHHPRIGLNARLDTLQAAILLAKLKVFPDEAEARGITGRLYSETIAKVLSEKGISMGSSVAQTEVTTPYIEPYNTSVFAQYTIQVENRSEVQKHLNKRGIPTAVHYPLTLNAQPALSQSVSLPCAERLANRVMSLPMHPYLEDPGIQQVANALADAVTDQAA